MTKIQISLKNVMGSDIIILNQKFNLVGGNYK